jgi:hypothetical protein
LKISKLVLKPLNQTNTIKVFFSISNGNLY